ncbi:alpha/beta hydrolase [Desulfosarcina alkanivorans]|uniref:Alpha/beta hydrolase n=1 Tax=Desulfosarcina alkanivorans TaxID=571177 RepID=A0A5K7YAQ5_9BACT|nr:alpha/beta fold hydrolase [Desulfosarcina alkanivorans]BBO66238.1 alpha/beta hydrolase [Desulfosarcina alkanivorans]
MPRKTPADFTALDRPDVLTLLFHPRKTDRSVDDRAGTREIRIPVEGDVHVGARFHMAHANGPCVLFFHGNGEIVSDYDDVGPLFNRLGINLMVVDYRGYGFSDGNPTVAAMMADCHRIFEFAEDWKVENRFAGPLIVMGRSLGSASALELAATRGERIDGLVIESGFAWAGPLLRLLGVDPDRIGFDESSGFANVDKIRTFSGPTVIIHAEFDHIIPFTDGKALFAASGAEDKVLVKIPGANHNDIFMRGLDRYLEAMMHLAEKLS